MSLHNKNYPIWEIFQPMQIAYRLGNFPKLSESFVLNEIANLEKRGHQVSIFAEHRPKEVHQHDRVKNLTANIGYSSPIRLRDTVRGARHKIYLRVAKRNGVNRALWKAARVQQFIDFLTKVGAEPDVIHGHFATDLQLESRIVADLLDCKHFLTAHAYELFSGSRRATAKRILSYPDRVITISEYNKSFIQDVLGVENKVSVIPTGIFIKDFSPTQDSGPNRILTVARCVEKKGIEFGIRGVAKVLEDYDIKYFIIGDGDLLPQLREIAKELGISDSVYFLGSVSDDRLQYELDKAGIFLLPSIIASNGDRDGLPVALKEAMAMETACVTTTVSAIPELIEDEVSGLLVPAENHGEIAKKVIRLVENDPLRLRIQANARRKAKEHDIDNIIPRLEKVFLRE